VPTFDGYEMRLPDCVVRNSSRNILKEYLVRDDYWIKVRQRGKLKHVQKNLLIAYSLHGPPPRPDCAVCGHIVSCRAVKTGPEQTDVKWVPDGREYTVHGGPKRLAHKTCLEALVREMSHAPRRSVSHAPGYRRQSLSHVNFTGGDEYDLVQ